MWVQVSSIKGVTISREIFRHYIKNYLIKNHTAIAPYFLKREHELENYLYDILFSLLLTTSFEIRIEISYIIISGTPTIA